MTAAEAGECSLRTTTATWTPLIPIALELHLFFGQFLCRASRPGELLKFLSRIRVGMRYLHPPHQLTTASRLSCTPSHSSTQVSRSRGTSHWCSSQGTILQLFTPRFTDAYKIYDNADVESLHSTDVVTFVGIASSESYVITNCVP